MEKVNKFSIEMIKVSSSTSKITARIQTAMQDTQAPFIGT